jgi:AraC-like DNA-binding protein
LAVQPLLEHIDYPGSLSCRRFEADAFDCPWHLHPEVEILRIDRGVGDRLVGDNLGRYRPGDLFLFAPDLPHLFLSDPGPGEAGARGPRSVSRYVQFRPDALGAGFFEIEEMRGVGRMLGAARRGLHFDGRAAEDAEVHLQAVFGGSGPRRVAALLTLLAVLHDAQDRATTLASPAYGSTLGQLLPRGVDARRMSRAIQFIHDHAAEPLKMPEAAGIAGFSPGGFSRAFRRATGRSFSDYLIDLRLQEACHQLLDTPRPILEICYAAGFGNLANFNRQFRKRKGVTPSQFRRRIADGLRPPDQTTLPTKGSTPTSTAAGSKPSSSTRAIHRGSTPTGRA